MTDLIPSFNFSLLVNGKDLPVAKITGFGSDHVEITKGLEQEGMSLQTFLDDNKPLDLQLTVYSRDGKRKQYYYHDQLHPKRLYIQELNAMESGVLLETLVLKEDANG